MAKESQSKSKSKPKDKEKVKDDVKAKKKTAQKTKTTSAPAKAKTAVKKTTVKAKPQKPSKQSKPSKTKQKPVRKKVDRYIEGVKQVNLYSISGKSSKKIKLPIAFDEVYRLDLIRRAVKASQANRRQPYGPSPMSGMGHSTSTWGKGRGVARVQRQKQGRRAVQSPNNVGGRRAHPPTVEKIWEEKINKKERQKARRAALAAIADNDIVTNRGHKFDKKLTLPLVLEDKFESIEKTKDALEIFEKLGVYDDVLRATNGKHIRAGKGKARGRIYRRPKSILIITTNDAEVKKSVGNLIGIDVVTPENLSIEDLAPGGDPGRLTIITEKALKLMGNW
jgi:large subunit ribosomal protein L4e